ncbi:hypothetical protein [Pseudomonas sp. 31-12]|uniref:hypothetical protein n=1 Tax=Pseudomonas sp. 31-12 TaxID=2201356 RepID=UPI0013A54A52|nr:hypothetical protein [Pseudomonas sp. 31-12]
MQIKGLRAVIAEFEPCDQIDRRKHLGIELHQRVQLELRRHRSQSLNGRLKAIRHCAQRSQFFFAQIVTT